MPDMPEAVTEPISLAYPLDEFYARNGKSPLPPMQAIDSELVPQPYRSLLVHENDMTSTLENFHGDGVHLKVHARELRADAYFRAVVLEVDRDSKPVEFGCIKIYLKHFPPPAREEILRAYRPLGGILRAFGIEYLSRPKAFLRVASDPLINELLRLKGAHVLYGRRNTLSDPNGKTLAEIIEILPPTTEVSK
jgi:chorismate-pyruvate lyase